MDLEFEQLAATAEVALGNFGNAHELVHGAVTAADAERAGEFFLHLHIQIHDRLLLPAFRDDIDGLKKIEVVDPLIASFERFFAVEVPLVKPHLSTYHLVAGLAVARDVDPTDPNFAAFLDLDLDGNGFLVRVDVELRDDVCKRPRDAVVAVHDPAYVLTKHLSAEDIAFFQLDLFRQFFIGEKRVPFHCQGTDPELIAFFDIDVYDEFAFSGKGFGRAPEIAFAKGIDLRLDDRFVHLTWI